MKRSSPWIAGVAVLALLGCKNEVDPAAKCETGLCHQCQPDLPAGCLSAPGVCTWQDPAGNNGDYRCDSDDDCCEGTCGAAGYCDSAIPCRPNAPSGCFDATEPAGSCFTEALICNDGVDSFPCCEGLCTAAPGSRSYLCREPGGAGGGG